MHELGPRCLYFPSNTFEILTSTLNISFLSFLGFGPFVVGPCTFQFDNEIWFAGNILISYSFTSVKYWFQLCVHEINFDRSIPIVGRKFECQHSKPTKLIVRAPRAFQKLEITYLSNNVLFKTRCNFVNTPRIKFQTARSNLNFSEHFARNSKA